MSIQCQLKCMQFDLIKFRLLFSVLLSVDHKIMYIRDTVRFVFSFFFCFLLVLVLVKINSERLVGGVGI